MKISTGLSLGITTLALLAPLAGGHFVLMEPAPWIAQNNLGDPQKLGPCGGTSDNPGVPTNAITEVRGGQNLHIKLQETVFHPGHYRIALAVNSRSELPEDPFVITKDSDKGPRSVSAKIEPAAKPPVLVDGLWQHTTKATEPFETDVPLPNINCPKCTLQIIEFMAEHGYNKDGGYTYHHCAALNIHADATKPVDSRWPVAQ